MKKDMLLVTGIAALTACAPLSPRIQPLPTRQAPQVTVANGKINVDPELIVFAKSEGRQRVVWTIPRDVPYVFHRQRGIVIEGEILDETIKDSKGRPEAVRLRTQQDQVTCDAEAGSNNKSFACEFKNERLMTFKYTIRVLPEGGGQPIERDPVGINGANM